MTKKQDENRAAEDGAARRSSADERESEQDREGEGFLSRWSRRKHQAKQDKAAEPVAESAQPEETVDSGIAAGHDGAEEASQDEIPAPEPLTDEDMPPLDSIDSGGSVKDFFSPKVSKKLRGAALKRLFSQPEFSAPDMLEEYAGDYSKPEPLGDVVTAEMRYRTEQAIKFAERKLKEAAEREGLQQQPAKASVPNPPEISGAEVGQTQDLSGQDQTDEVAEDGARLAKRDDTDPPSKPDSGSENPPGKRD